MVETKKLTKAAFDRLTAQEQFAYVRGLYQGREMFPGLLKEARQLVSEIKAFPWDKPAS